ncbi:hypothetical protein HDV05_004222 [Chytridiales sp. JEL 0842]|nr:hypothetical protein HDV05_004222 [Chytridiales sp. JEL 0842]
MLGSTNDDDIDDGHLQTAGLDEEVIHLSDDKDPTNEFDWRDDILKYAEEMGVVPVNGFGKFPEINLTNKTLITYIREYLKTIQANLPKIPAKPVISLITTKPVITKRTITFLKNFIPLKPLELPITTADTFLKTPIVYPIDSSNLVSSLKLVPIDRQTALEFGIEPTSLLDRKVTPFHKKADEWDDLQRSKKPDSLSWCRERWCCLERKWTVFEIENTYSVLESDNKQNPIIRLEEKLFPAAKEKLDSNTNTNDLIIGETFQSLIALFSADKNPTDTILPTEDPPLELFGASQHLSQLFDTLGTRVMEAELKIRRASLDVYTSKRQRLPKVNESIPRFFASPDPWKPGYQNLVLHTLKLELYTEVVPPGLKLNPIKALREFLDAIENGEKPKMPWEEPIPISVERQPEILTRWATVTAYDVIILEIQTVPQPDSKLLTFLRKSSSIPKPAHSVRHTYIVGPRVFQWKELVECLEREQSVDLIEREFGSVEKEKSGHPYEADIVVDEKNCIIICPLHMLPQVDDSLNIIECPVYHSVDGHRLHGLRTWLGRVLIRLSLQFHHIWVVIDGRGQQNSHIKQTSIEAELQQMIDAHQDSLEASRSSVTTGAVMSHLVIKSMNSIHVLGNILKECYNTTVHGVWAHNVKGIASICRQIGNSIAESYDVKKDDANSKSRSKKPVQAAWPSKVAWETRSWLWKEESMQEKFVCSFPVFNAISAQIILSQMTLREFIGMDSEEKRERLSLWIPEEALQYFHEIVQAKLD